MLVNNTARVLIDSPVFDGAWTIEPEVWTTPTMFRTWLTPDDLAQFGLQIRTDPNVVEMNNRAGAWRKPGSSVQWLERILDRDATGEPGDQFWREAVIDRIAELRAIAAEEALPFCEASAAAALAFVGDLPLAAQPGAFLVGGNVRLLWRTADGEQVGLQFRGADKIQFVNLERDGDDLEPMMGTGSHAKVRALLDAPTARRILLNG